MSEPTGLTRADGPRHQEPPTNPTAAGPQEGAPADRPFHGFDRERATYDRLKPGLLVAAPGKFVAIVGEECEGPVATFGEAQRAGFQRFGLGPIYIKEVLEKERVHEISRDIF